MVGKSTLCGFLADYKEIVGPFGNSIIN
jgi:hypothetical protein